MTGCTGGCLFPAVDIVTVDARHFMGLMHAVIVTCRRLAVAFLTRRLGVLLRMGKPCNFRVAVGAGNPFVRSCFFECSVAISTLFVGWKCPEWRGEKKNYQ